MRSRLMWSLTAASERTVQWLSRGASELLAVAGMQEVHVVSLSVQVVLENPP